MDHHQPTAAGNAPPETPYVTCAPSEETFSLSADQLAPSREVETDMADSFLGTVGTSPSAVAAGSTPWTISISVKHVPITFNIDT